MKINWILPEATQCGGVRMAFQYANALTEYGHDVVCYIPKSGQHWGWKKIFFPKELLRMHFSDDMKGKWFNNKFPFHFPVWITDNSIRDADVTIATSWITSYWVNGLKKDKGKKVYFIQGFETWGTDKINKIVMESYKLPFDKRITVSTALHDRLLSEAGADSEVVCNGVEKCFLKELKKKCNNKIVIGMPYRDVRGDDIKNCGLGLKVLLKIKRENPDIEIVSFGFVKPQDWNEEITFVENPSRDELVELYNKIDIFYVPSVYEGWGLPAMEAMAQSSCVLAANSGIIREIGIDGENCIILQNPRDEQEAIDKIEFLIQNPDLFIKIGKNAREEVLKMSTEASSRKFEKILKDICNKADE